MQQKRRYPRRKKSSGMGQAVGDTISLANRFSPKGTLIVGVCGFVIFYFVVPWAMTAWAEYNNTKMSGQHAAHFAKLVDSIIGRRFIRPSEWIGIAILVGCTLLAFWKAVTRTDMSTQNARQLSGLSKLLARLLG